MSLEEHGYDSHSSFDSELFQNEPAVTSIEHRHTRPALENLKWEGFEGLEPTTQQIIRDLFFHTQEYLAAPIIADNFGNDHEKRREWRREMRSKYGPEFTTFYGRNKLRLGALWSAFMFLQELSKELDEKDIHTPQAEKIRDLNTRIPSLEGYGDLSEEGKRDVVKQVDALAEEVVQLLS